MQLAYTMLCRWLECFVRRWINTLVGNTADLVMFYCDTMKMFEDIVCHALYGSSQNARNLIDLLHGPSYSIKMFHLHRSCNSPGTIWFNMYGSIFLFNVRWTDSTNLGLFLDWQSSLNYFLTTSRTLFLTTSFAPKGMFQTAHLAPFDVPKNSTFAVTNCCRLILRNLFWSYASDFLLISVAPSHTIFQDEPNILSPKEFIPGHALFLQQW